MAEQKLSDLHQPPSVKDAPDREEEAFLKEHRKASFWSSITFAVAGASFIGMLGAVATRIVTASEESEPLFKEKKRTPLLMAGMAAFGTACIFASNWLESKKTLLEWRMGGSKVGRKISNADRQADAAPASPVASTTPEQETVAARADGKSWQQSVSESKREWERTA